MCFSCFASENGVMLPAPPDSLQTWRPRAIDLIRSLYPQVENIALVTDNTYGGISLQALVRAEWENYPDLNLVLVDSREGEETAFRTYATLPPRSAVMLGTWRVGSDGEYFMQRSLNDLVQNNPRVPVFSVTGTGIGDTAIGGYVPEYENGAEVIANQIRKYYDTDDIEDAHFHTSKSLYLFDSRKLKEWKIAEYALPKGSVIEDTMAAKLSKYSHYIELLVAGILLLVLLLFVTWLLLRMRRLKLTLEEREGQLVVAREKAEESDMLKSAFLANMSHEIRTPLNAIVGFSSLMQSEELSQEERAEYCAIVVSNSEMLLTLLNDILDISSLECGKIRFNYASEDIVQICQHVMMTTAHTRQRGVEGRFACPVGSFMLTTDAHRLSQILINLLTNAGKFTSEGSITLGVEIDEERGEVLFSVADTGPGIPPDKQDLVFNRFEKLDGNKKKGTGLGLAICRQIAMIVGGRIWVDSAYTGGTRFVFAHPIGIDPGGENREGGGFLPSEQRKSLFVNDAGTGPRREIRRGERLLRAGSPLFRPPFGLYADEEFGVHARHGPGEHREVLLVEKVVDRAFERQVRPPERETLFEREVAHQIGRKASGERDVVARHGVAFAVIAELIEQAPAAPGEPSGRRGRIFRFVGQLFADRPVGRGHRLPLVDRRRP